MNKKKNIGAFYSIGFGAIHAGRMRWKQCGNEQQRDKSNGSERRNG